MSHSTIFSAPGLILCVALVPTLARAQPLPDIDYRFYVDAGSTTRNRSNTAALGVLIPTSAFNWIPRKAGPLSLHWDLALSSWRALQVQGGRREFTQLSGIGVWRYALGGPDAPLFLDFGLGISVFDRLYTARTGSFSTAFQFTEAIGLGYRFGKDNDYEISVRAQHISNAGIKKPNPGAELVRLRFAFQF